MGRNPDNMIKSVISETIVEEMLRDMEFFVLRLGKEYTANPLTQLERFVKLHGGNFSIKRKFEDEYEFSHPIHTINKLPDFVTVTKKGVVDLIEVKYRKNGQLWEDSLEVFHIYPEAFIIVINRGLKESDVSQIINMKNVKVTNPNELIKTKFHVWTCEEKDPDNVYVYTLKDFLRDQFEVRNDHIINKYEELIDKWIGDN